MVEIKIQRRKWKGVPMEWYSVAYFPTERCDVTTYRTHDIGRPGKYQRIACKVRGRWKTQSFRLSTSEWKVEKDPRTGEVRLIPETKKAYDLYRKLTRDHDIKLIKKGKERGTFLLVPKK